MTSPRTDSKPNAETEPTGCVWAVVPVKSPRDAKTRLSPLLTREERSELVEHMLCDVLEALSESTRLAGVLVITPNARIAELARSFDASVLEERDPGLNRAIEQAREHLAGRKATGILVVPADLPLLTGEAADRLIAGATADGRSLVLAPDAARTGTNAFLRTPPDVVEPAFGPGSFERHASAARDAGAELVVLSRPELELDLDEPADVGAILDRAEGLGHACRTIRYLTALGVGDRLRRSRPTTEDR